MLGDTLSIVFPHTFHCNMKERLSLLLLAVLGTAVSGSSWQRQPQSLVQQEQHYPKNEDRLDNRLHRRSSVQPWSSLHTTTTGAAATAALTLRGGAFPFRQKKVAAITGGTASIATSIFNLVNNVAGAGILALAAGKAGGTGWVPAVTICCVLGALSAHSFIIVGRACELTGEKDFKGLWSRTIGETTTYCVDSMIAIMCLAVSVIYSGILGDVATPLLTQAGLSNRHNSRATNILAITLTLLLPMSLVKNLSALAFTSILGFSAILYTVFFILVRALDGSYTIGSGKFVTDGVLELLPTFQKSTVWNCDFTSLILTANMSLAYIANYNAPSFYRELKDTSNERFRKMVVISFGLLVILYVITMAAGYSTFGDACQGNILLNCHPDDILSNLGRVATWFSILFGFPLVMSGAREGLIGTASSMGLPQLGSDRNHFGLVASLLALVTIISCFVEDVSLVVGLTGAAMGSFIVYLCPAIIYTKAVALAMGTDSLDYKRARINLAMVPFGILLGGFGVYMTLKGV